ncbi:MAG TPA: carboxymuconolactone decarboxylase family protein [Gemmatimonadales bacterium]|nr:carboxymuconolactone decarboxylase family protein [Gemmatimonadales bacterium]
MTAVLDPATRALVRVALGVPGASEARLAEWLEEAGRAGTPALWIDEMLISSLLYVGYPRALVALGVWRRLAPEAAAGAEAADYGRWPEWRARGEATCRAVYGKHYDQLRLNVRALHPALEQWMIVDGYGKTLGRPGLDLRRRELCSVALLIGQQVPRQLLSHLRGALHAGAPPAEVDEVLELAGEAGVFPDVLALARDLWRELRDTLQHD